MILHAGGLHRASGIREESGDDLTSAQRKTLKAAIKAELEARK